MYEFKTQSPDETYGLGVKVANLLQEGDIICLAGNLGAGKTVFVQGMASALDVEDIVTSPTFNILNVYEGRFPVYHFDLYRLDHSSELTDVGFYEYTSGNDGVAIIEWPDKFPEELPDNYLWIDIKHGDIDSERLLVFRPQGARYVQLCEEI